MATGCALSSAEKREEPAGLPAPVALEPPGPGKPPGATSDPRIVRGGLTSDLPEGVVSWSFSTWRRRPDSGPMPATV